MNKQQTLQIEVSEQVKVLDVFVTFKKWVKKAIKAFKDNFNKVFTANSYVYWKAVPVRGPDVSEKLYIVIKTTSNSA